MTNFYIELDNKFDEIFINLSTKNNFDKNDLIELKSFIIEIYNNKNKTENEYIRKSFNMIDFKI
jgi:hypothetical protein